MFIYICKVVLCFILFFTSNLYAKNNDKDISSQSVNSVSSLMNAALMEDIEGVKIFSNMGKDVINKRNFGGATALHIISRIGNADIARHLISKGAYVNITDNEGWTPLLRGSNSAKSEIVKTLVENNSNITLVNNSNQGALELSVISGCIKCIEIILDYAKRQNIPYFKLKSQLDAAIIIASKKIDKEIETRLKEFQLSSNIGRGKKGTDTRFAFLGKKRNNFSLEKNRRIEQNFQKRNKAFILKNKKAKLKKPQIKMHKLLQIKGDKSFIEKRSKYRLTKKSLNHRHDKIDVSFLDNVKQLQNAKRIKYCLLIGR